MQKKFFEERFIKALEAGDLKAVKLILDSGINVDFKFSSKPHRGSTPLIISAYFGNEDVVEELLDRGADIRIKNFANLTARYWARSKGYYSILNMMNMVDNFNLSSEFNNALNLPWVKLSRDEIGHITLHKKTGRKISRIFNFKSRDMIIISKNLKTNAEAISTPVAFNKIDMDILKEAFNIFRIEGGVVDKSHVFKGRVIFKTNNKKL